MRHGRIGQFVLAFTLVAFGVGSVQAAELEAPRVRHRHVYRHAIVLPPERHVIEVEKYAYSERFIINGARVAAQSPPWASRPVRMAGRANGGAAAACSCDPRGRVAWVERQQTPRPCRKTL